MIDWTALWTVPRAALTLLGLWRSFIRPRLARAKLRRVYALVEDWFDEIDRGLEAGLNMSSLANKEMKVASYIRDHQLGKKSFPITARMRRRFLKDCGLRPELCEDRNLFAEYSRWPESQVNVDSWWLGVLGAFYRFHKLYSEGSSDANFADVEMRLKLFRMLAGVRSE
jgi:hypothetical protein